MFSRDALHQSTTAAVDLDLNPMCALGVVTEFIVYFVEETINIICTVCECLFPVSLLLTDSVDIAALHLPD